MDIERREVLRGELVDGVPPPPWDGVIRAPRGGIRFAIPESIRRKQDAIDVDERRSEIAGYAARPVADAIERHGRR